MSLKQQSSMDSWVYQQPTQRQASPVSGSAAPQHVYTSSPNQKPRHSLPSSENLLTMKYNLSLLPQPHARSLQPSRSYESLHRSPDNGPCSGRSGSFTSVGSSDKNAAWSRQVANLLDKKSGVEAKKSGRGSNKYRDFACMTPQYLSQLFPSPRPRGGVSSPFPVRLYKMLDSAQEDGYADVVCWQPHGRSFCIHDRERFVAEIMPKFFMQTKFPSFQRQLNLYGFCRLTRSGPDQGAYFHERCLRGMRHLAFTIPRSSVNGNAVRQCQDPEKEPLLHVFPPVEESCMMAKAHCLASESMSHSQSGKGEYEMREAISNARSSNTANLELLAAIIPATSQYERSARPTEESRPSEETSAGKVQLSSDNHFIQSPFLPLHECTMQHVLNLPLTELDLDLVDAEARRITENGEDDELPSVEWD